MPPRRLFTTPEPRGEIYCIDCIHLSNDVDDLKDTVHQLSQRVALLTLQINLLKNNLLGSNTIEPLDLNGDLVVDRWIQDIVVNKEFLTDCSVRSV